MQRPTGVVLIAALYIISAVFMVLVGVAAFFVGGLLMTHAAAWGVPVGARLAGGLGAIVGIVVLVFAALALIVGIGLIGLKNWARIVAMVLSIIGAIGGLFSLLPLMMHFAMFLVFWALVRVAINILIVWYLNQPTVKQAFGA
jgi:hypothetical protein